MELVCCSGRQTCCISACFFVAVTCKVKNMCVNATLQHVWVDMLWFILSRLGLAEVAVCYLIGCDHPAVSHTGWHASCWVTSLGSDSKLIFKRPPLTTAQLWWWSHSPSGSSPKLFPKLFLPNRKLCLSVFLSIDPQDLHRADFLEIINTVCLRGQRASLITANIRNGYICKYVLV